MFKTNSRPLLVRMITKGNEKIRTDLLILKNGDDVRRDMAVMQIFKLLNSLWSVDPQAHYLGTVEAIVYEVVAMSISLGL